MLIIVTGVSGTGKTTIGNALSEHFQIPFYDGDLFHPAENIAKMSAGHPLDDNDRKPWLELLAQKMLDSKASGGCILGCSALKEKYRQILSVDPEIHWVHLIGDRDLIWDRMTARQNHFMKAGMLDSQFATWEEPDYGVKISIDQSPEDMVAEILDHLEP